MADLLPPSELRALLARTLAYSTGQSEARWETLLGEVKHAVPRPNPRTNWRVTRVGSSEDRIAIRQAIDLVRKEHPNVYW